MCRCQTYGSHGYRLIISVAHWCSVAEWGEVEAAWSKSPSTEPAYNIYESCMIFMKR